MEIKQKIDINLYHLWSTLNEIVEYNKLPKNIVNDINKLENKIDKMLYKSIPGNRDITKEEAYLVISYK